VASAVPHDLLTPREVAEVIRVSTMTVYRLIKSGELPAMRVGKHLRIRGSDVAEFLDARIVPVPAPRVVAGSKQSAVKGSPWPVA
jgi:excisionase family DNA binding protein